MGRSSNDEVVIGNHGHHGSLRVHGFRRRCLRQLGALAVALIDVVDHQRFEVGGNGRSTQGAEFLAVDTRSIPKACCKITN